MPGMPTSIQCKERGVSRADIRRDELGLENRVKMVFFEKKLLSLAYSALILSSWV